MVVDDDDKPDVAPASNAPADEKVADEAPTEPPEGEEPEGEESDAEQEATEEEPPGLVDDEQDEDDEDEGDAKTRLQRYREQRDRLQRENEALRANRTQMPSDEQQLQRAIEYRVWQEIGDPPKPEDFKEDYVSLSIARQAYENDRRAVTREVRKEFVQAINAEQQRLANLVADHKDRVAKFEKKVPDYKQVMAQATHPVAPHVERLLIESKKSEQLGYVLAKNPGKLDQLNRMEPQQAAREIGRMEARLSLPKPKTQTQARKPITPLKGAGRAPPSPKAGAAAYMKKLYGDNA